MLRGSGEIQSQGVGSHFSGTLQRFSGSMITPWQGVSHPAWIDATEETRTTFLTPCADKRGGPRNMRRRRMTLGTLYPYPHSKRTDAHNLKRRWSCWLRASPVGSLERGGLHGRRNTPPVLLTFTYTSPLLVVRFRSITRCKVVETRLCSMQRKGPKACFMRGKKSASSKKQSTADVLDGTS